MPGTKSSTVGRKKKRPPHLRKKMQLRRKKLPLTFVSSTVPATTSQPVTSIATSTPQPVPATTSQPVPATPQPVPATTSQPVPATPQPVAVITSPHPVLSQPLFATPQPVPTPPVTEAQSRVSQPSASESATSSGTQKLARTASLKKLSMSPHTPFSLNKTNDTLRVKLCDKLGLKNPGKEVAIVEIDGLQSALEASVMCSTCGSGPVVFERDYSKQVGLCAHPFVTELLWRCY